MSSSFLRAQKYAFPFSFRGPILRGTQGTTLRVHVLPNLIDGTARRHICHQDRPCAPLESQITQKPRRELSFYQKSTKLRSLNSELTSSLPRPSFRAFSSTVMSIIEDPYRSPTNVKPTHYDITIKTDLEDLTFQGFVKVEYVCHQNCLSPCSEPCLQPRYQGLVKVDTTKIVLNTSDLDLGKAYVFVPSSPSSQAERVSLSERSTLML